MKTFEEAIAMAIPRVEIKPGQELAAEIQSAAATEDVVGRYAGIAREAANEPHYRFMASSLIHAVSQSLLTAPDAIMTAFVTGCVTGCEMEKHETGGILWDPPAPTEPKLSVNARPVASQNTKLFFDGHLMGKVSDACNRTLRPVGVGKGAPGAKRVVGFRFFDNAVSLFLIVDGVECRVQPATTPGGEDLVDMGPGFVKAAIPLDAVHLRTLAKEIRAIAKEKGISLR